MALRDDQTRTGKVKLGTSAFATRSMVSTDGDLVMKTRNMFFTTCATIIFSASVAQAGACSTANKDALAGPMGPGGA